MSIATRRYTYQDLLNTPDDGKRYEIIDGELYVSAAPAKPHFWLSSLWFSWLAGHVRDRDLGMVFHAPVDVRFDEENTVEPDLLFIRKERLQIVKHNFVDAAPDLLVEIESPSTRRIDRGKKFELYRTFGVPEYWVANPDKRNLRVYVLSAAGAYERVQPVAGRLRSTVLPDLVIDLSEVFGGLP
jgi:Uma2 family endonuclease